MSRIIAPLVLIVDDTRADAEDLAAVLSGHYECKIVDNGDEAVGCVTSEDPPDAVLLDVRFEGGRDGFETLDIIHRHDPTMPIIMVTQFPDPADRADALNRGAIDYLAKGGDLREILAILERRAEIGRLLRSGRRADQEAHPLFLTGSQRMRALENQIDRIAQSNNTPVLISGERGTGKTLIGYEIHRRSPRAAHVFQHVNCSDLTEDLVEGSLFGHRKGAYTSADSDQKGHLEAVGKGTVLLSQIESLRPRAQGSLLMVLEERMFRRLGETDLRRFEGRILADTNRDLDVMVKAGEFRGDLLDRLRVAVVEVPPLREHAEDIPSLANFWLGKLSPAFGRREVSISDLAMERLRRHTWPGNVRELRNTIERALVLNGHKSQLLPDDFDLGRSVTRADEYEMTSWSYKEEKDRILTEWQRHFFNLAFREVGGSLDHPNAISITRVAQLLSLTTKGVRDILRDLDKWHSE